MCLAVNANVYEVWCTFHTDKRICVQFVMRHAPGARALKFVRRLPLFKGLGDNNLVSVASRMREKVYQVSFSHTLSLSLSLSRSSSLCQMAASY
jgi:hypothetical protein